MAARTNRIEEQCAAPGAIWSLPGLAALLAAVPLSTGEFAILAPDTGSLLAAVALWTGALFHLAQGTPESIPRRRQLLFLAAALTGTFAMFLLPANTRLFAIAAIAAIVAEAIVYRRIWHCASLAILLFALLRMLYEHSPSAFRLTEGMSRFWTESICSTWSGTTVRMGSTSAGVGCYLLSILVGTLLVVRMPWATERRLRWILGLVAALAIASILAVNLRHRGGLYSPDAGKFLNWNWLHLIAAFIPLSIVVAVCGSATQQATQSHSPFVVGAVSLAALVISVGVSLHPVAKRGPATIFLHDDGFLDWDVPVFGKYGILEGGMFGELPLYLKDSGWKVEMGKDLPTDPSAHSVMVLINPTRDWSADELQRISSFVEGGGGLLVLGDHTDIRSTKASLNAVLEPYGIEFLFDSGFPAKPEWVNCLSIRPNPINRGVKEPDQVYISVGATLAISRPAAPVVVGKHGFSDLGNRLNEQGAFLGNYAYEKGEHMSDVVLVAESKMGEGRVVAFGDTSPFQNGALPSTFDPFVLNVFNSLREQHGNGEWVRMGIHGAALLLAGFLAHLFSRPAGGGLPLLPIGVSLAGIVGLGLGSRIDSAYQHSDHIAGELALIDMSHGCSTSMAAFRANSVGALANEFMRNGYRAAMMKDFSAELISKSQVLSISAPTKKYSAGELGTLRNFATDGGLLVICSGWQDRGRATAALLAEFGFDVMRTPLGPYPVVRQDDHLKDRPQFINAWPIVVTDAEQNPSFNKALEAYREIRLGTDSAVAAKFESLLNNFSPGAAPPPPTSPPGEEVAPGWVGEFMVLFKTAEGFPVVVARKIGRGAVVVVGDTNFLGHDNLATMQYHREGNILFLQALLKIFKGGSPEK